MKILVTLRLWRRPRGFRKHILRHKLKTCGVENDDMSRRYEHKSSHQNNSSPPLIQSRESDITVRRSIEKTVYIPDAAEVKCSLPPTYDECVEYAPPLDPPPIPERERGRPRELLYKLQLNDMMRRQRRPSPAARRPIGACSRKEIDYRELMWGVSRAAGWAWMFRQVQCAAVMWLVFLCLMLVW